VARWMHVVNDATADETIAQLGLGFALVTSQTSLVAVDETPSRPAGERLRREELPLLLPAGWDFDILFGGAAAKGMPDVPGAGASAPEDVPEQVDLPETATCFLGTIGQGVLLLAAGLAGLWLMRRRGGRVPA